MEELPLRDIHLPDSVSWWPLAPGWWIVLFLLIAVITSVVLFLRYKKKQKHSSYYLARKELAVIKEEFKEQTDSQLLVSKLSVFFRRSSVQSYERTDVASLTGMEWLVFLERDMEGKPFSEGPGKVLIEAPYQKQSSVDKDSLFQLCERWIESTLREQSLRKRQSVL